MVLVLRKMNNQRVGDTETGFWRHKLQQMLPPANFTMIFVVLTGALGTLLLPLVPNAGPKETPICLTLNCNQEASRIKHQLNLQANPCEDLYEFVCGNSQRHFDPIAALKEEARTQIIELYYTEAPQLHAHPILATMKMLFHACLNEVSPQASEINVAQVKKALKMAGGWPLLEGSNWDERKFSWSQATYKFRELGYNYKVFVNLSVTEDPSRKNKNVLRVSLPKLGTIKKELIVEIAVLFGANKTEANSDVDEMYNSILPLFYMMTHSAWNEENHGVLQRVSTYQEKQASAINWLELINKIIGPATRISGDDLVVFPYAEHITMWFNFLSRIPKRIQANYIMWKAIEEVVADIKLDERQQEFWYFGIYSPSWCLEKIQKKFKMFPNPMDVLYIRKYLPSKKLHMVEDLVNTVNITFFDLLTKANWLDVKDKKRIVNTMRDINSDVIIGAPKIYLHDNILDEIAVDLKKISRNNYLQVLLQVGRNYESLVYKQIHSSVNHTKSLFWNLWSATEESLHYYAENAIVLPATILQGTFFDVNKPNYLSYGSLGSFVAAEYAYKLVDAILTSTNKTQQGFLQIRRCFLQQVKDNLKINGLMAEWDYKMLHQVLSTHVSYSAYKKWEKSNGIEPTLASSDYSNYQLFWISAASFYCKHLHSLPKIFNMDEQYKYFVSGIGLNNHNFAKDFDCPLKSKMNPIEKCYVL